LNPRVWSAVRSGFHRGSHNHGFDPAKRIHASSGSLLQAAGAGIAIVVRAELICGFGRRHGRALSQSVAPVFAPSLAAAPDDLLRGSVVAVALLSTLRVMFRPNVQWKMPFQGFKLTPRKIVWTTWWLKLGSLTRVVKYDNIGSGLR
jgi:hypothetical protein